MFMRLLPRYLYFGVEGLQETLNRHLHYSIRIVLFFIIAGSAGLLGLSATTVYGSILEAHNTSFEGTVSIFSGLSETHIDYQSYVTPDAPAIEKLASRMKSLQEAYSTAINWTYVPEEVMYNVADEWTLPETFITETPQDKKNPVPGIPAGDCEEQANTLASLIRAMGVPPEHVRVVLGVVSMGQINKGHVWVELYRDGRWLSLDPSQGPHWDEASGTLIKSNGLSFDYYASHPYPVTDITAYYNDKYYAEVGTSTANVPDLWKSDIQGSSWQTVSSNK